MLISPEGFRHVLTVSEEPVTERCSEDIDKCIHLSRQPDFKGKANKYHPN